MNQIKVRSKKKIIEEAESDFIDYIVYLILTTILLTASVFELKIFPIAIFFAILTIISIIDLRYWNLVERLQR